MSVLHETEIGGDDLIERGQNLYEESLKSSLESQHAGRFAAVEPASGRYFLGDTGTAALVAARAAMPESRFYLVRIGRRAAHTIGGHATRVG